MPCRTFADAPVVLDRSSTNDSNWYVIQKSVIYGNQSAQAAYLGRPWHNYARVVFQENYFSDIM